MKNVVLLWRFCWAVVLLAPSAAASEAEGQPLTFSQAIVEAAERNPQVVAARFELSAAASQVVAARSGLMPQLNLSETFNRTDSPLWAFGTKLNQGVIKNSDFNPDELNSPDAVNNFNTALSLSWRLFDGGQTRIGWKQAIQGEKVARLGLLGMEQQAVAQAGKVYVGLLLAVENLAVIEQSLQTSQAHFKLVEDRFRSGLAVKSDLLRAQVRIADLEQQRLQAQSRVQMGQAALRAALGREEAGEITLTTRLKQDMALQGELAQWLDRALRQRPDLKQLEIQEAIAKKEVARAKAGHMPTLALQGNYEINSEDFNDNNDNYAVGAVMQVNLYSGRRISSQTAAAKANVSRAKAMRQGMALTVRVETQRAYYQAQSVWQSIEVARKAVGQAQEGLRIVSNRYAGGLLTIVDLLDAQVALQQARTQHFKAMHDFTVARIELALAAGTINREFH